MCYQNNYPAPSLSQNLHIHKGSPVPRIHFRHVQLVSNSLTIDTGDFPNVEITLFFEEEHMRGLRDALYGAANEIENYLQASLRKQGVPETQPRPDDYPSDPCD